LSAINSGVKDDVIEKSEAKWWFIHCKKSYSFIDEIHRFSKSQQDFVVLVEKGWITLIGATTETQV
jgi:putative ATPase